jgi:hypothetical protein
MGITMSGTRVSAENDAELLPEQFDNIGIKKVSKTDKSKRAYVVDKNQQRALRAANCDPDLRGEVTFTILGTTGSKVKSRYYLSKREGSGRDGEPRLGKQIMADFADVGDLVMIANRGSDLFILNISRMEFGSSLLDIQEAARKLADASVNDLGTLMRAAMSAGSPPKQVKQVRREFVRNPIIAAAAIARAQGRCETPNCTMPLFRRPDGSAYLEVHHVLPMSEGGYDAVMNTAALCPSCHRELHYGISKDDRRATLLAELARTERYAGFGEESAE